jgi:hypothetical protein
VWRPGAARTAALVAALLALALGGCAKRDVQASPFHLSIVGPDGASLATGDASFVLTLSGTARVTAPAALVVAGAVRVVDAADATKDVPVGDVTVSFDGAAAPDLAFPSRLEGQEVLLEAAVVPGGTGPRGEPLPVRTVRLATGPRLAFTYEYAMGETTAPQSNGVPSAPVLMSPYYGDEDLPFFTVVGDWTDYQPGECGLVYLDVLRVVAPDGAELLLRAGTTGQIAVGLRPEPWTVRHVLSWHRRGKCGGQSGTWTQIAAWR